MENENNEASDEQEPQLENVLGPKGTKMFRTALDVVECGRDVGHLFAEAVHACVDILADTAIACVKHAAHAVVRFHLRRQARMGSVTELL